MPNRQLICVIDDDQSVCSAIVELIVALGHKCRGHSSAEAALESGDAETAACIVTDIHMPGLDGFALKALFEGRGIRLGLIMMTARDERHLETRALDAGAMCFLRKPLHAESLARCLASALGELASEDERRKRSVADRCRSAFVSTSLK